MCRSQAQGGRRCNGSGKAGGSAPSAADWNATQPYSEATIRENATDTFNRLSPGPLSEATRRQITLRDRGYTGWIDQDGYAVAGEPLMK